MGAHITYDTDKRIIIITTAPANGEVFIDVQADLYSDVKEDWLTDPNLHRFRIPIRSTGGDPLPGQKQLGATFFLDSRWKIRPYEANHKLSINGNLFSEDGTSVIVPTLGNYNVLVEMFVSNLSDSTIQQLTEIEYSTYGGGVTVDVINGVSGQEYPVGTPANPVDNMLDAVAIISAQKLPRVVYIVGDLHLTSALPPLQQYSFIGQGMDRTIIDIDDIADVTDSAYFDAHVTGTLDGNSRLQGCFIDNLIYIKGFIQQCVLSEGIIILGGSETAHFLDCWSGVPGSLTPTIDCGGSGQALALRNYNGGITLRNKSGTDKVSLDLNSGQIILENTVTNGEIVARGVGKLVDDSNQTIHTGTWNGVTIVNETVNAHNLAYGVWEWPSAQSMTTLEVIEMARKLTSNRQVIDINTNTLTVYDDDGLTPLIEFDLQDRDGNPNSLEIFKRIPK
jgi:hypothetical protein